ncbi:MAG TPA: amidohydrolase, partial [Acidimicrobiaceae bacterium]|nr:amidohydrolase [Acidimicrobiaceae bacterium]
DYPHSDSSWPRSPELLMESIAELPVDEVEKISHENAMRHYRFDPFAHRPKEACTVGVLRAGAADVDTT